MPLAHFKSKRIAAASRGFLAAALLSCLHAVIRNTASVLVSHQLAESADSVCRVGNDSLMVFDAHPSRSYPGGTN